MKKFLTDDQMAAAEMLEKKKQPKDPGVIKFISDEEMAQQMTIKQFTLGNAAELLKDGEIEVIIQTGTGFKPSSTRRIQQKQFLLQMLAGTKAQPQIMQEIAEELGTSLSLKELSMQAMPPEQGAQQLQQQNMAEMIG
jgi:hypothetical protein